MGLDEEAAQLSKGGGAFILEWFTSIFYGDSQSAHATNKILQELLVFYVLVAVGFGALILMWRSNIRLKALKRKVARAVREQRGRRFEPQDAARMYGMF
ncbi:hypothetical protein ACKKBG_A15595 [Auxenochlorella protothecoides x Auxenochlorella symbiontica]|uniref:Uncharacterized protein n=1 Tax=Auxenochlorella protothecoides TaxID=3075 RepID=A0A087ST91_AUXPR|nr:hypothetical protein F751_4109 [Auxenochlorella protothecoides]KFM28945.1 hypothetical protein F751_4109 [Auxenochlorella protothecoides]RMZ57571.1 hypothetical protein APUTEX25_001771 [Auxenochlorella protothecoides]|eukprot:RMZ57571.1 hypothetical protein APUTEX25_001771 [Auxenochlorella protothecoides]